MLVYGWIGGHKLDVATCPLSDLHAATFATLTFTSQKNGVRGETIGHSRSGHPILCLVLSLASRLHYLRLAGATPTTPINATRSSPPRASCWQYLKPSAITAIARAAVLLSPDLGILPSEVSARTTRAGGAMALMCAGVDSDRIRLIGRWRSSKRSSAATTASLRARLPPFWRQPNLSPHPVLASGPIGRRSGSTSRGPSTGLQAPADPTQ